MGFESLLSHVRVSETVNRAALAWVRATVDPEATEVTDFTDRTERRGNCDTCGWDQALVDVSYRTPGETYGWGKTVSYEGNFAEFIRTLDEYDI